MALDPEVTESIEAAVREHGQNPAVSKRLLAWLTAASTGAASRDKEAELFAALTDAITVSQTREEA